MRGRDKDIPRPRMESRPLMQSIFEKGGVNEKPPENTKPQGPPPSIKKKS